MDNTALVTGASSGIGVELAKYHASMAVILSKSMRWG
jgi:short-subunit dehydrogenase